MVGSKAGVLNGTETPAPTDGRPTPRYHRHPLGRAWLVGLAVIPLLIAMISYGAYQRPLSVNGPTGELPTLSNASPTSSTPGLSLSLISISRSGKSITLIGDFPDDSAKAALMKSMQSFLVPGVTVIDQIHIDPIVHALDFTNAEAVFTAGAPIPDFSLKVERDTVTLTGTAGSPDQKVAVERAAISAWPGVTITNKIEAKGAAPPPGPAGACADLQSAINALTGGPIPFADDGVNLTPADHQILTKVAEKLKSCPDARVTLNGYADNTGAEGINVPLSAQRAATVADYLIVNGVARDHVATKGLGSLNPIAGNDTPEGRTKNRRVEIVVG